MIGILSGCAVYEKCGVRGCPGDAEITAHVESLFKQHPELEPPNMVTVQTLDGVVYLYGLVETDLQRHFAGDVASQAVGGTQVVNAIGVINR
jgi:osmotically-inducible protein OsmY